MSGSVGRSDGTNVMQFGDANRDLGHLRRQSAADPSNRLAAGCDAGKNHGREVFSSFLSFVT